MARSSNEAFAATLNKKYAKILEQETEGAGTSHPLPPIRPLQLVASTRRVGPPSPWIHTRLPPTHGNHVPPTPPKPFQSCGSATMSTRCG